MKKKTGIFAIAGVLLLAYLIIGNPAVAWHNRELRQAVTALEHGETVTLNEVVPFAWDTVYTFSPYTSREEIEETIGFRSRSIQETVSEGMVQLLFVKGRTVTASVCGYADALGYRVSMKPTVSYEEHAVFTVDANSAIVSLTQQ